MHCFSSEVPLCTINVVIARDGSSFAHEIAQFYSSRFAHVTPLCMASVNQLVCEILLKRKSACTTRLSIVHGKCSLGARPGSSAFLVIRLLARCLGSQRRLLHQNWAGSLKCHVKLLALLRSGRVLHLNEQPFSCRCHLCCRVWLASSHAVEVYSGAACCD